MIFDKLWQLERQLIRSSHAYARHRKLLEKRKASREEMESAGEEGNWANNTYLHQIEGEESSRLLRRADRLGLPIPRYRVNEYNESDEDEAWEVGYTGIAYLTRAAQPDLLNQIRMEKKASREEIVSWIRDIGVPLIGVLGVLPHIQCN
jgi:hypothetical protein